MRRHRMLRRGGIVGLAAGAVALATTAPALASVGTDAYYYDPGDTVQISGDSMGPDESVTVDVDYPDGSLAQEDVVSATDTGTFSDSYVVPADAPYGVYTVVATGQTSGSVFTTTFDPSTRTSLTLPDSVTYGAPITLSGSVVHTGTGHAVSGADVLLQEDANQSHDCSTHTVQVANDNTGFVTLADATTDTHGAYSDEFHPQLATFPPSEDTAHTHYFITAAPSVGTYGFRASHKGNLGTPDNAVGNISTSGCKTTSVIKAPTTTAALLANGTANDSADSGATEKITYHVSSHYGVSGNTMYGGVSAVLDSGPNGGALGCVVNTSPTTDTPAAISSDQTNAEGGASETGFDYAANDSTNTTSELLCKPNDLGVYTFHLHFADNAGDATNPDGNYQDSDSGTLTLTVGGSSTVLPEDNQVTDSGLCTFDVDTTNDSSTPNEDFRLIYTQDPTAPTSYKLTASNPGQFYYNVLYRGSGGETVTLTIPYPFVTQGAVPTHVYDSVLPSNVGGQICYDPSAANVLATSSQQVTLNGSRTVTVSIPANDTFAYINIHLDYGLKGTSGCAQNTTTLDAVCANSVTIANHKSYAFSASYPGVSLSTSVNSENVFKRDPGIGGLILTANGQNPLAGTLVRVYDSTGKLLGTVTADQDGWYMWNYKYTGKAASFTVTVPSYGKSQTATLKSNGFLVVNFSI